jgi:hypothetical protein
MILFGSRIRENSEEWKNPNSHEFGDGRTPADGEFANGRSYPTRGGVTCEIIHTGIGEESYRQAEPRLELRAETAKTPENPR